MAASRGALAFCKHHPLAHRFCTRQRMHYHRERLRRLLAKLATPPPIPHLAAWLCIHHYEGSWTDPNPPYWGGLQMDVEFMQTYGADMIRKYGGYANLWSPRDQMLVAERAYESGRGFYPWPTTARECGLI